MTRPDASALTIQDDSGDGEGAARDLLAGWPSPPLSPWREGELASPTERCRVELADGRRLSGSASRFLRPGGMDLAVDGEPKPRALSMSALREIRLTRPLSLAAPPADPALLRRAYRIRFAGGAEREGESAGAVHRDEGLYLFPPIGDTDVSRIFVPAERIADFSWNETPRPALRLVPEEVARPAAPAPAQPASDAPVTSVAALLEALAAQQARPIRKLGEVLLESGLVDGAALEVALLRQRGRRRVPLGEVLVEMGAVRTEQLKGVMAQKLGIPRVDARSFPADPEAQRAVPRAQCHRHVMVPLCFDAEGRLVVAMDNPLSAEAAEAVRFA